MMQLSGYLRIVRASAWYDLLVTIGFATPWTFAAIHQSLGTLIQTSSSLVSRCSNWDSALPKVCRSGSACSRACRRVREPGQHLSTSRIVFPVTRTDLKQSPALPSP